MNTTRSQLGRFILLSCLALLSGRETLWASDDQTHRRREKGRRGFPIPVHKSHRRQRHDAEIQTEVSLRQCRTFPC